VARHRQAASALGLSSALLLAVPNPAPADSVQVEAAIHESVSAADAEGLCGAEITPFILKRVAELTGGKSLDSNISLVENNAKVGAQVAAALAELKMEN